MRPAQSTRLLNLRITAPKRKRTGEDAEVVKVRVISEITSPTSDGEQDHFFVTIRTKRNMRRRPASLFALPNELLQKIIWLAGNPAVYHASKALVRRLDDRRMFLTDLVLFAFCGWSYARDHPEVIPWQTGVARGSKLLLDGNDRDALQMVYLEEKWCTVDLLEHAASLLARAWLKMNWCLQKTRKQHRDLVQGLMDGSKDISKVQGLDLRNKLDEVQRLRIQNCVNLYLYSPKVEGGDLVSRTEKRLIRTTTHVLTTKFVPTRVLSAPNGTAKLKFLKFIRQMRPFHYFPDVRVWSCQALHEALLSTIIDDNPSSTEIATLLIELRERDWEHPIRRRVSDHELLAVAAATKNFDILCPLVDSVLARGVCPPDLTTTIMLVENMAKSQPYMTPYTTELLQWVKRTRELPLQAWRFPMTRKNHIKYNSPSPHPWQYATGPTGGTLI